MVALSPAASEYVISGWMALTHEPSGPQMTRMRSSSDALIKSFVYGPSVPIQVLPLSLYEFTPTALKPKVESSVVASVALRAPTCLLSANGEVVFFAWKRECACPTVPAMAWPMERVASTRAVYEKRMLCD